MPKVERVNYDTTDSLTVSSTAVALSSADNGGPTPNHTHAFLTVETDQVRFTVDGTTAPTSSVGHLLNAGDTLLLDSQNQLQNVQFIRITTDVTVKCSFGEAT